MQKSIKFIEDANTAVCTYLANGKHLSIDLIKQYEKCFIVLKKEQKNRFNPGK